MTKKFALTAEQITPLATGRGGCLATDRITVDGRGVGYMYRETPNNNLDSGWRFFAGDEDDSYMAVIENHNIYDVNTIANYSPSIVPYLDAPAGSAFYREGMQFLPDAPATSEERG
jgi:hypothetical protein